MTNTVFDMYSEILMNGFVPDRIYFMDIDRWVDKDHPLTAEEFSKIFGERYSLDAND